MNEVTFEEMAEQSLYQLMADCGDVIDNIPPATELQKRIINKASELKDLLNKELNNGTTN